MKSCAILLIAFSAVARAAAEEPAAVQNWAAAPYWTPPARDAAESRRDRCVILRRAQRFEDLDRAVDAFLTENNETAAASTQSQLNSTLQLIETYKQQIATQEVEYQKLLDARVKLESRLTTMRQQRTELQSLLELGKSKEIVGKTIKSLDDLTGSGDTDIRDR